MPSNLALYRKICVMKSMLEIRDEKGIETSKQALEKAIKLVDEMFTVIERRSR